MLLQTNLTKLFTGTGLRQSPALLIWTATVLSIFHKLFMRQNLFVKRKQTLFSLKQKPCLTQPF